MIRDDLIREVFGDVVSLAELQRVPWAVKDGIYLTAAIRRRVARYVAHIGREGLAAAHAVQRERIASEIKCMGDEAIARSVVDVVAALPPPVLTYVVNHALFVGVGKGTRGWCSMSALPLVAPDDGEPWRCIALATSRQDVIAHEIGHLMLTEAFETPTSAAASEMDIDELAVQLLVVDAHEPEAFQSLVEARVQSERYAACLAKQWGFIGTAADPFYVATRERRALYGALARLRPDFNEDNGHENTHPKDPS